MTRLRSRLALGANMHICLLFVCLFLSSCRDGEALGEASFGTLGDSYSKAGPTSVISMGRDDDDGKAQKWHIGGGN